MSRGFSQCAPRLSPMPRRSVQALELARVQDYEASRQAFENTIQMCPNLETAWVSWAQVVLPIRSME